MYVLIVGGGKVGNNLAHIMRESDNDVAIIEQNPDKADMLAATLSSDTLVICGDGCDSRYQEDGGIRHADVFVAVTGQDDNNLVACEIAKRVFDVPRCVARVNSPKNVKIFRKLGIESIASTTLIATLIEEEALAGSISVANTLSTNELGLIEISVPKLSSKNAQGVSLSDIDMPEGSVIVAKLDQDTGDMDIADDSMVLHAGESLIVAAETDVLAEVRSTIHSL